MGSGQPGYADGWVDALGHLLEELRSRGLSNDLIEAIYDHYCDHYDTLYSWCTDGARGDPPPAPPFQP